MSSKFLLEELGKKSWSLNLSGAHVIEAVSSESAAGPAQTTEVKELVFAGAMTTVDGLKVFCEAIDIVASELAKAGISVTFAGVPNTIDNVPSEEWIDIYAGNWQDYGLEWQIVAVRESSEILEHLSEKSGRVAVLPSLFDASSVLGQELLFAGFPFIASTESALQKMIITEDLDQVLVEPTADALGAKFTALIGQQGMSTFHLTHSYYCPSSQYQICFY